MRAERGRLWESRAAAHLERHGLTILARGYRCRLGEIDLVCRDDRQLVIGGAELGAATQNYIYFLVAQDGTYLVKHRSGEQVHDVKAATPHDAVRKPGADGRSTNALEVRVAGNTISYVVNGTVVHTTPKSGMTAKTDGLVGIRVNHLLDVHIDGFAVKKA